MNLGLITKTNRFRITGLVNQRIFNSVPSNLRFVSTKPSKLKKSEPRLKYLLYIVGFSWVAIILTTADLKSKPDFKSTREYKEYEESTGLRRRNKIINYEKNEQYKFYTVPFVHSSTAISDIEKSLLSSDPSKQVKVIDPVDLIAQEKEDESRKYHYLLHNLDEQKKAYPKGLITALIKQEVSFYLNTRSGTFDTNFILKNFPQTTEDAIKFENEVSDVQNCLVVKSDIEDFLKSDKSPDEVRLIDNVIGYFESVGRNKSWIGEGTDLLLEE